jgi:hypothetical protein
LKIDTFVIFHHTSLKKGRKVQIQLKPDDFYFCSPASGVRLVVVWKKDVHQKKTGCKKYAAFIKIFSAGNLEVEKIWCDQYLFGVILRYYFS